ncbi:Acetyltransferase (GNAT) domain-containing protein [Lentibacillus persicus]|uniref:Acetyltransferase (GNAT) domain-containing protein n=1 Tax=Lentibacillus persicus TaxID=640948 RepID=A0A1I1ZAA9_9BACI|nr:GNAT family N-acetyltransferase [Lentibacillus persicus]SFE28619.1 Acetyltransferase (GNAT) domain-containing protein [Lentibacillus persicus]
MKKPTFQNIETIGHVIEANALYRHYHYPEMLIRYDSNFIDFKQMPSLEEFKQTEALLQQFHKQHNQTHLKFEFPENEKPGPGLVKFLDDNGYDVGFTELYAIRPEDFPALTNNPDIQVKEVTGDNLDDYIRLQYENDKQNGEIFANEKINLNKKQFDDDDNMKVIAYCQRQPAGTMNVILSDDFVEIDDLAVSESLQRKGIGGRLQQFVMSKFYDRMIILVADGEDTPREMYQRQNYQYLGFKYEALRID